MDLPDFNTARTGIDASQLTPPFEFDGVMMRVFPLRANLEQVQSFIDAYLNVAPRELAYFRTFLPYVYLMIINYGKMSVNAANLGWISQNEVAFSVPLLWYKQIGGQLVFHDFAYVSPFIFVDNDLSMTTGREVYGWPKSRVTVDTFASAWMTSPEASPVLARFSAMVFPELYAGMRETPRTLLEIGFSVASSYSRVPFDPRAAWLPWVTVPKAIAGSVEMVRDYIDVLRGIGFLREQPGAGPRAYASMLGRLSRSFSPYSPKVAFNTVNLKQFRDAEMPNVAAYQAITNARMSLRRFKSGGLLGDRHTLQGDPSGGFSIDIHRYATAPILESLGLEVAAERTIGGTTVHTLRPMFPLWLDVDMRYDVGQVVAWRSRGLGWHDGERRPVEPDGGDVSHFDMGRESAGADSFDVKPEPPAPFNTARGAAGAEITGPFDFPSVTLRVMPLLADEDKLAVFLRGYLGEPLSEGIDATEVLPWGRFVYLVASSYEEMSSTTNDIGWWADRDLVLYVPARVMRRGELWKVVLVPAYAYASSATAALTGAEVSGMPIAKATLDSPSNPWMDDEGPRVGTRRALLAATTMVLPAIELGQKAVERVVVEVFEGDPIPRDDEHRWRSVGQGWMRALKEELREAKERASLEPELFAKARALALQVLCEQRSLHLLTLKQFRDSEHPTKACYRAVVQIDREIVHAHRIEEIETSLHVRIHRYPTQPIVETLGLVTLAEEVERGGVLAHVLQPVRPFWMKVSLKEHLGQSLVVRTGDVIMGPPPEEEDSDQERDGSPAAGSWTVKAIDREHEPRRLQALVHELVRSGEQMNALPVSDEDIADVVEVFDPQAILGSILSDEWERWDDSRWLAARVRIEGECAAARDGRTAADAAFAEFDALWSVMDRTMTLVERRASAHASERLLATLLRNRLLELVATHGVVGGGRDRARLRRDLTERYGVAMARLGRAVPDDWKSVPALDDEMARIEAQRQEEGRQAAIRDHSRAARAAHRDLLMILAKAHQKPHHAIRRGAIANASERERVLPIEHCWDEHWYIGSAL